MNPCQVNITPLTSCFTNPHGVLWHTILHEIHISQLPSKSLVDSLQSLLFPTQSAMDFLGCHVNNTPLTISFKSHFPFTVMSSLSPLIGKNPELGGFSIGYVQFITSEPTDNQVSSFSPVGTISLSSCPVRHLWMTKFRAWWLLDWLCPCHLWTDR